MKKELVYLNYYQTMMFLYKIEEFKKENSCFNDVIVNQFEEYVSLKTFKRKFKLFHIIEFPESIDKFISKMEKYTISESMFNYLVRLTDINPIDKKVFDKYLPLIKEYEEKAISNFLNDSLNNKKENNNYSKIKKK